MVGSELCLLSLDGGGVRGLSTLYILRQLMELINPDEPAKPCEYFDIIGGTSTGGLIAIMLGRLKMDIRSCIKAYQIISDKAFQHVKHRVTMSGKVQGRFDTAALEESIKGVLVAQGLDPDTLLKDDLHAQCKVFVCAVRGENRSITHLTSYRSPRTSADMLNGTKIWEAARATSSASTFFDPIKIGSNKEEFLDGATGSNNPVREVFTAAKDLWPSGDLEQRIKCFVSIGTGQPSLEAFGDNVIDVAKTLKHIATDTEYTAEVFRREHRDMAKENRYFRFNVEKGLEEVGLEDSKRQNVIVSATRRYYESQPVLELMEACQETLSSRESNFENSSVPLIPASRRLITTIRQNDLKMTREIIESGIDVNYRTADEQTPLGTAAKLGRDSIADLLLSYNADTELRQGKSTPICWAAEGGHQKAVKLLLDYGADVDSQGHSSFCALAYAACKNDADICNTLISYGANLETKSDSGLTPLLVAASWGASDVVELLLRSDAKASAASDISATALHCAAARESKRSIELLLKYIPIDVLDKSGATPLHWAVQNGRISITDMLIQNGADIEAKTGDAKFTPLLLAIPLGNIAIVKLLLREGASVTARDSLGDTALHMAVHFKKLPIVKLLLSKNAPLEARGLNDYTPLFKAVISGNILITNALLVSGADIHSLSPAQGGKSPLMQAIDNEHPEIVEVLVEKGANVNTKSLQPESAPLHRAAWTGNLTIISFLIQKGAKLEDTAVERSTPLHWAANAGRDEAVKLLVARGANIKAQTSIGWTALHCAARAKSPEMIKVLVDSDISLEAVNQRQETALHIAVTHSAEATTALLQHGASLRARDKEGATPLHLAAWNDSPTSVAVIEALVEFHAPLEATDSKGMTALHGAASLGFTANIKILLDAGADLEARDSSLASPLALAANAGLAPTVSLLLSRGAAVESRDISDLTPLNYAAHDGRADVAKVLLDAGADIEAAEERGCRPLYQASANGHTEVTRLLLDRSADVEARTKENGTPLLTASLHGYVTIVEMLLRKSAAVKGPVGPAKTGVLHYAAKHSPVSIVKLLLRHGADPNELDPAGLKPVHYATKLEITDLLTQSMTLPVRTL